MYWIAAALVAGCARQEAEPMKEGVRVEIASIAPDKPVEGDVLDVKYRVVNDSKEVVVLGGGKSEYGSLYKDGDDLVHDTMSQQATRPVFYERAQIVLPGEIFEGRAALDALEADVKVGLAASAHAAGTFAAYIAAEGGGMERRFKRATVERLKGSKGSVILEEKGRAVALSASRKIPLAPRSFPLAEARRKFGEAAESVRWSKALEAWVMASSSRTALVKADGAVDLPAGAFPALADFESGKQKFQFRLGEGVKTELATTFKTYEGDGMYTHGTFIDIPRERLVESLRRAREEKLAVRKVFYFFQSYYFEFAPAK